MEHFKFIGSQTYEWTTWDKCKVKFKFDNSLENRKIIVCDNMEDNSIIVKLNCQWENYDDFKHLLNELDTFCESSPIVTSDKIAFPSRRFIRDLVDNAYGILIWDNFISKIYDKIYLGLALYYLILSKKSIFPEEYIEDHYELMNFCRKAVINKFDPRMKSGNKDTPFIHLLCHYWKHTFTKYSMYFTEHDPEKEVWKIISLDCACNEPDWHKSKLLGFWKSDFWKDNERLNEFLLIIKDLIKWFGTERYNLPAMNRLIDIQKGLGANLSNNKQQNHFRWSKIIYNIPIIFLLWLFAILLLEVISHNKLSEILFSFTFPIITLCILWYFIKLLRGDVYWFKKIIPRLFGAIIVGYIPLIMENSVCNFGMNIQWYVALQIVILSLFASGLFIVVKISKSVSDRNKVIKRTRELLLLGLAESLIVGLVLCSLFSGMLICENTETFLKMP